MFIFPIKPMELMARICLNRYFWDAGLIDVRSRRFGTKGDEWRTYRGEKVTVQEKQQSAVHFCGLAAD